MMRAPVLSIRTIGLFIGLLALLVATIALPGGAGAQTTPNVVIPVTGKLEDGTSFRGKIFNPEVVYRESTDSLRISGILRYKNDAGETVRQGFNTGLKLRQVGVGTRVHQDPGNCRILILNIGPIHLDLLGLVVDTDPIRIDVTAVPGAGNLLCAVAGLLDPNEDLAAFLQGLLTRLFRV